VKTLNPKNIFRNAVLQVVKNTKPGELLSYKEVAVRAGNPHAARAVAKLMANNYDPQIPCHRVIRSDGTLGGYNRGGTVVKKELLEREGAIL